MRLDSLLIGRNSQNVETLRSVFSVMRGNVKVLYSEWQKIISENRVIILSVEGQEASLQECCEHQSSRSLMSSNIRRISIEKDRGYLEVDIEVKRLTTDKLNELVEEEAKRRDKEHVDMLGGTERDYEYKYGKQYSVSLNVHNHTIDDIYLDVDETKHHITDMTIMDSKVKELTLRGQLFRAFTLNLDNSSVSKISVSAPIFVEIISSKIPKHENLIVHSYWNHGIIQSSVDIANKKHTFLTEFLAKKHNIRNDKFDNTNATLRFNTELYKWQIMPLLPGADKESILDYFDAKLKTGCFRYKHKRELAGKGMDLEKFVDAMYIDCL